MQASPPSEDFSLENLALRVTTNQGALLVMAAFFAVYLIGRAEEKRLTQEKPVFENDTEKALFERFKAEQRLLMSADKDAKISTLEAQLRLLEERLNQLEGDN